MNLECAAGGSAWKRPIVGNQKCLFRFSGSSYHFGEKKGKLRAGLDSPGNSCTMRPRRVPSHEEAMNLVRSGTKQPQWIFFSAEDKARLFFGRFSCVFRAVGSPIMPNSFDLFPLKCLPNINDRSGRNRAYFTVSNSI